LEDSDELHTPEKYLYCNTGMSNATEVRSVLETASKSMEILVYSSVQSWVYEYLVQLKTSLLLLLNLKKKKNTIWGSKQCSVAAVCNLCFEYGYICNKISQILSAALGPGFTQPLAEMRRAQPVQNADNIAAICKPIV
jgi:hypothetical protein